jgi:glyoxylate carboligase
LKAHIITCERPVSYVDATVESATKAGFEPVVYESPKPSDESPRWHQASNALHLLSLDESPLLLCEDDILFTTNAARKLQKCIESIPVPEFVLTLYSTRMFKDFPVEHVNPKRWEGSQAMFFTDMAVGNMKFFLRSALESGIPNRYALDLAIRNFCIEENVPLFCCNPSLVQHVGNESLCSPWATGKQHSSPSFRP